MVRTSRKDRRRKVARGCWEWMPGGRRPRGRPRTRWKDTVEELKRHDLSDIRSLREKEVQQGQRQMEEDAGLKAYSWS